MTLQPDATLICRECGITLPQANVIPGDIARIFTNIFCRSCFDWLVARSDTMRHLAELPVEQQATIFSLARRVRDKLLGGAFDAGGPEYVAYLDACGQRWYGGSWVPLEKRPKG